VIEDADIDRVFEALDHGLAVADRLVGVGNV